MSASKYLWFESYTDHSGTARLRMILRTFSTEHMLPVLMKANKVDVQATLISVDGYLSSYFDWLSNKEYFKLLYEIERKLYDLQAGKEVPRCIQKQKKIKAGDRMPVPSWHW